jgi:hypothetical protein
VLGIVADETEILCKRRHIPDPDRVREHPWRGAPAGGARGRRPANVPLPTHGNLQATFAEARKVLGMTSNYQAQFKELADRIARETITAQGLHHRVLRHLWTIDEDLGKVARHNRERTIGGRRFKSCLPDSQESWK